MKTLLSILTALTLAVPALAQPEVKPKSYDAMGCMLLQECTEGVTKITGIDDIKQNLPEVSYVLVDAEFESLVSEMRRIGIGVFLASSRYFPPGHRGVYHTVGNNFFLNMDYMWDPQTLIEVTRHEGWHAAQDCMAGTIDNNNIAIIYRETLVPQEYHLRADIAYAGMPHAMPWEREAMWSAEESYMTVNALKACKNPNVDMWSVYPPTPMTGEWLIREGFWDGKVR